LWGRLPIWNHSSSDDEVARRFVITLPTRASKYLIGAIELAAGRGCSETLIVASDTRFAATVATGAERRAIARGMRVSSLYIPPREWVARRSEIVSRVATVDLVLLCGALHDDIETVAALRDRGESNRSIAAVGAGVREFGRALGPLAEGVIGPSQWEPEEATVDVGPRSSTMVMGYRERYGRSPDYLAIQAWACGALAEEAVDRVGPKPDDQWTWASRFPGRTAYGDFRLDQKGRQVGHELRLVEWDAAGNRHVLF
jgi:ABC-type branched-subunit amino acid transport system substrate-binding protein